MVKPVLYEGFCLTWHGTTYGGWQDHQVPNLAAGEQLFFRFVSQDPNHDARLQVVDDRGQLCYDWHRPQDLPKADYQCECTYTLTAEAGIRYLIRVGGALLASSHLSNYQIERTLKGLVRQPWPGQKVCLLLPLEPSLDPEVIARLLEVLDECYDFYRSLTGYTPHLTVSYEEKLSIAVVPDTCGAGCGHLGGTGIELLDWLWDLMYQELRDQQKFDGVLFYELGRNFWNLSAQAEYLREDPPKQKGRWIPILTQNLFLLPRADTVAGCICTGFAVAMRNLFMLRQHIPPNESHQNHLRRADRMVEQYLWQRDLTWENTLRIYANLPGELAPYQATDLFAAFLQRLWRIHGDPFLTNVWRQLAKCPPRQTTQEAVDNLIWACCQAAGVNLSKVFRAWRWPVSKWLKIEAKKFGDPVDPVLYRR